MNQDTTRTPNVDSEDDKGLELVDIIAEEVSDVERAANRRKYLVIKRETDGDGSLGPEIFDDERGDEGMNSEPDYASLAKARRSRTAVGPEEPEARLHSDVKYAIEGVVVEAVNMAMG